MEVTTRELDERFVGDVLARLSTLMGSFHERDMALQDALANLSPNAATPSHLTDLQHVDLLTQSHCDLSNLLKLLSEWAHGKPTFVIDLQDALTLRSLQDKLITATPAVPAKTAGDVSFF